MSSLWRELAGTAHEVRYVDAAGIRTRVLIAGSGDPVLLLHGTGGHLEAYLRTVGPLARRYQVIAIDLLGHGYTGPPSDGPYDWAAVAEHVLATMDALGLERATLVGEALGAQAAQWTATRYPERVDALVLVCAAIAPSDDPDDIDAAESQRVFQDLTRRALTDPASADVMRERMGWLHLDPAAVDDELLAMRMQFWAAPGFPATHAQLLGSLRTARQDERTAVTRDQLAAVEIPTLVVWTERNPLMSLAAGRRVCSYMPRAQLLVFERSAMWPQFDEAERFNHVLQDWLESQKEPTSPAGDHA